MHSNQRVAAVAVELHIGVENAYQHGLRRMNHRFSWQGDAETARLAAVTWSSGSHPESDGVQGGDDFLQDLFAKGRLQEGHYLVDFRVTSIPPLEFQQLLDGVVGETLLD